jgi:hypothetical protein
MLLALVEYAFQISGRGCVIVPGEWCSPDLRFRAKDRIQLRRPDGRILDTHIASVEMLSGPELKGRMAFLLPRPIDKSEAPPGTEIWLTPDLS